MWNLHITKLLGDYTVGWVGEGGWIDEEMCGEHGLSKGEKNIAHMILFGAQDMYTCKSCTFIQLLFQVKIQYNKYIEVHIYKYSISQSHIPLKVSNLIKLQTMCVPIFFQRKYRSWLADNYLSTNPYFLSCKRHVSVYLFNCSL